MELKQHTPHNQWVKEAVVREWKKYIERCEDKNTTYQSLQETAKEVLRGKFTAVNVYIKKEISPANNLLLIVINMLFLIP